MKKILITTGLVAGLLSTDMGYAKPLEQYVDGTIKEAAKYLDRPVRSRKADACAHQKVEECKKYTDMLANLTSKDMSVVRQQVADSAAVNNALRNQLEEIDKRLEEEANADWGAL